ncbi:unnamed protein product [Echinostoma caproni]|uniref:Peptidase A2 domain-containing protein n=1 Tax=Echinostoma caproni TaxID=27848 RepID=A0A183A8U9_9TREM|nr:unnamed protein product [Echinostoma caproni]
MEAIVMRLPSQLRFKWAEVATTLIRHGKEPQFDELASFIEERVDIVSSRFGELAVTLKGSRSNRQVSTSGGTQFGVRTLAVLDSGSDSTLVLDDLVTSLQMKGKLKDIVISTLNKNEDPNDRGGIRDRARR